MLVNATAMLQAAVKGHYAVGAFNTNNLEWASSILDAAEELQSPVIIQCTSGAAKWQVSYKIVADMVKQLVEDKNITGPRHLRGRLQVHRGRLHLRHVRRLPRGDLRPQPPAHR